MNDTERAADARHGLTAHLWDVLGVCTSCGKATLRPGDHRCETCKGRYGAKHPTEVKDG